MKREDELHNLCLELEELFENHGAGLVTEALWIVTSGYATKLPTRQPTQARKREAADLWSRIVVACSEARKAGAALTLEASH